MENEELNDIDFVQVFQKTKKFFTSYFRLLIVTSLLGVLLSGLIFYVTENYYVTEFVVSNGGTNKEIAKTIFIAPEDSYLSVDNLALSENEIDVIKEDIANTKKIFADTVMRKALRFEIKIYDKDEDLKSLKNSIINLLTKNRYIQETNKRRKEQKNIELVNVNEQIMMIDSLQKLMLNNNGEININSIDYSKNLLDLMRYRVKLEDEINNIGVYKVIRDIYTPKNPERTLGASILFGIILGFFIGIIVSVTHQLNQLSKQKNI